MLQIILSYLIIAGLLMLFFTLLDIRQQNQRRARRECIRRHPVSHKKSGI